MNQRSFDHKRIADGYAKDRPYLHPKVIEIVEQDLKLKKKLSCGLDIGCGAGLSTKALMAICERVVGMDISQEMICAAKKMCAGENISFYVCEAEKAARDTVYDIVTAAGVVNWVDQAAFLNNANYILKANGYLVIYDFGVTDEMRDTPEYKKWWEAQYLPKFPKPFRNEGWWSEREVEPFGFQMERQKEIELTWEFDIESFVRFMLTQSNVNEQIDKGNITEHDAEEWFRNTLSDVFAGKEKNVSFHGYVWCQTAHCGRRKPHVDFGTSASPTAQSRG